MLLSPPHGKRGIFWRSWDQETDWKRLTVTADQCPRISKELLRQELRSIGKWYLPRSTAASSCRILRPSLSKGGYAITIPIVALQWTR